MHPHMDPVLESMYHQFNIGMPEPYSEPCAASEFMPIVLIQNFQHQDSLKVTRCKFGSRRQDSLIRSHGEDRTRDYLLGRCRGRTVKGESIEKGWIQDGGIREKERESDIDRKNPLVKKSEEEAFEQGRSHSQGEDSDLRQKKFQQKPHCQPKKQTYIKWNQEQNMKYLTFIRENTHLFKDIYTRRINKTYKMMSEFIKTRNHEQCRSHHQKMIKKHKTFDQIQLVIESRKNKEGGKNQQGKKKEGTTKTRENITIAKAIVKQIIDKASNMSDKFERKVETDSPVMFFPSFMELQMGSPETNTKQRIRDEDIQK